MKRVLFLAILAFSFNLIKAQGSTFVFFNTGTNAQIDTALNFTGRIWGQFLNSTTPIKVNIIYTNLGSPSNLAITIPNGRKDFANAPLDSVWYPSSLANSLALSELNPTESDMDIYVNSSTNWYFDTLGNPGAGQYDFVTVMLHEMGHGLAFLSLAKLDGIDLGSFGLVTASDILPLTSSFPFPVLEGKYSTFAAFMENGSGQSLVDTTIFPNNSIALGDEFTSNDVYFDGPLATVENGGTPVRLYAPATYASGSSMQHLHESIYPASNPNSLMTPFINVQEVHHHPGNLTIAMMEDMGWNVNYVSVTEEEHEFHITVFPNPATEWVMVYPQSDTGILTLRDIQGRVVLVKPVQSFAPIEINMADLAKGTYILELSTDRNRAVSKLILE